MAAATVQTVHQAYRLALDPTPRQRRRLASHTGASRFAFNWGLARRLADVGLGELRRQLGYKTAWAGGILVEAETFYPSSKTCSGCGYVKAKLPLSERPTGASSAG